MWARGPEFTVISVGTRDGGDRGTIGCCVGLQMERYIMHCVCCWARSNATASGGGLSKAGRLTSPGSTGSELLESKDILEADLSLTPFSFFVCNLCMCPVPCPPPTCGVFQWLSVFFEAGGSLSVKPGALIRASVTIQLALGTLSLLSEAGITGELLCLPGIYVGHGDPNSGP